MTSSNRGLMALLSLVGALSASSYAGPLFTDRFEYVVLMQQLNDTGVYWCSSDNENFLDCPVSGFPGQDAEHGRDRSALEGKLEKIGQGRIGFDFSKVGANGEVLPPDSPSWACVRDNHTGLLWERKTDDPDSLNFKDHTYSWYSANSENNGGSSGLADGGNCVGSSCDTTGFVDAVSSSGLCGTSKWRLPNVAELLSIVDYSGVSPAIDSDFFPHTSVVGYASATPYSGDTGRFWGVSFNDGGNGWGFKTSPGRVRLVSGKTQGIHAFFEEYCSNPNIFPSTPTREFEVIDDGASVVHLRTGLEWKRCPIGQVWDPVGSIWPPFPPGCRGEVERVNWHEALNIADGAGDGWRLPNLKELSSLVEVCMHIPALNPEVFPGVSSRAIWSSTPRADSPNLTWTVDFIGGNQGFQFRGSALGAGVRLVRDLSENP